MEVMMQWIGCDRQTDRQRTGVGSRGRRKNKYGTSLIKPGAVMQQSGSYSITDHLSLSASQFTVRVKAGHQGHYAARECFPG